MLKSGQELYKKAKKIIPGGTQLLSKRPEIFLPEAWPAYYSKAKGCYTWDLQGNKFVDMTTNGIGACILGFADDDVNDAVKKAVDNGSMSTLNSPDEVVLAKKLIELHPWAEMVRYARTGGESLSVAVRIARASTGRNKVIICGYHGWSDWYLAANLSESKALDNLLLPGLDPNGVPDALTGSTMTFHYNKIEELEGIISNDSSDIAAIVMEPLRSELPKKNFLQNVRKIADKIGAVLIIDEITAGWRFNLGGVHLTLDVTPDITVFAKTISNGYPMAAIIGTEKVMNAAQSSFISSTYWTEAIGPAAALATIAKMEKVNISEHVNKIGTLVQKGWKELAGKHGLEIIVEGFPPLSHFGFKNKASIELKTLFTQEMLKRGYLASNVFYPTFAHNEEIIADYFSHVDEVFAILAQTIEQDDAENKLEVPVSHTGFSRLT